MCNLTAESLIAEAEQLIDPNRTYRANLGADSIRTNTDGRYLLASLVNEELLSQAQLGMLTKDGYQFLAGQVVQVLTSTTPLG